ncbi:MAG: NADH-quinone oxidoreductase subunit C [Bdellovibrionota bacterium]
MDVRTPIPSNGGYWITQFGEIWKSQIAKLREKFSSAIEEVRMPPDYPTDMPIVFVRADHIVPILKFVRDEPGFEYGFLSDITATDEEVDPRFEIVYNLFSHSKKSRIRFKVRAREGEPVPTATVVWEAANWLEREIWDMYGVKFTGHPDLRRILMDERWVGHPLRKDYPLRGYQIFAEPEQAHPGLLD